MPSTYTELKLELIANGEQSGTWGTTTNVNLGTAIEEALVNTSLVAFTGADKTLTLVDSNVSQPARNMRLNLLGTSGGARNLTVPAIQKNYIVANNLADTVTVKTPLGTGIAVPTGNTALLYVDGTNVLQAFDFLPTAKFNTLTLTNPLAATSGGTGLASYSAGGALFAPTSSTISSGTLPTTAGGTGLTSYTSGGAVYATSTSALASGTLPTTAGGTGRTSYTPGGAVYATSASALASGTLPIASGGTNSTATPTAGGIPYGDGTAYAFTAAGTAGQVLTSNGSSAPVWATSSGGGLSWQVVQTGNFTAIGGYAYPINTTSVAITVSLPSTPIATQQVLFADYAGTWGTRAVTVNPNGKLIYGSSSSFTLNVSKAAVAFVYVDNVQGWIAYSTATPSYFTTYPLGFLLAGGGGGGGGTGGGGAGGVISTGSAVASVGTLYTIIVGAGGNAQGGGSIGGQGGDSTAFGTTALGGGGGGAPNGAAGGSGGGAGGGAGNGGAGTPGQGFKGGNCGATYPGSPGTGGGGAAAASADQGSGGPNAGGSGITWAQNGLSYGGGGGGGSFNRGQGAGGLGGGGQGIQNGGSATPATDGTGGGGGGGVNPAGGQGVAGAKGVCVIYYAGSQRGTGGTVTTTGGYTYHTFTASGNYTA